MHILKSLRNIVRSRHHSLTIHGIILKIQDYEGSTTAQEIAAEINGGEYGLDSIPFEPGDVVIDIGGHVGVVSLYLAKKHPSLKIYAFEPFPENFQNFQRNIHLNSISNVVLSNEAITCDRREMLMIANVSGNSGGATAHLEKMQWGGSINHTVASVTLDDVFERHNISQCKLLKIDCEGGEYEILHNTKMLKRIVYLRGEFHINSHLERHGYSIEALEALCKRHIDPEKISYTACRMFDG